jgi:hypothetical protein
MRHRSIGMLLFVLADCGDNVQPSDPLALQVLVDTNADPDIVEVSLVASVGGVELRPGEQAEVWGYRDGSLVRGSPSRGPHSM